MKLPGESGFPRRGQTNPDLAALWLLRTNYGDLNYAPLPQHWLDDKDHEKQSKEILTALEGCGRKTREQVDEELRVVRRREKVRKMKSLRKVMVLRRITMRKRSTAVRRIMSANEIRLKKRMRLVRRIMMRSLRGSYASNSRSIG